MKWLGSQSPIIGPVNKIYVTPVVNHFSECYIYLLDLIPKSYDEDRQLQVGWCC